MTLFKEKNPSRGTQGKTLLHESASLGCLQTFIIVQEQVENKNPKDKLGNTPLHQAVLFGMLKQSDGFTIIIQNQSPQLIVMGKHL